jgi:hypothetical protein
MRLNTRRLFWGLSLIVVGVIALSGASGQSTTIGNLIWYGGWISFAIGITIVATAVRNSQN